MRRQPGAVALVVLALLAVSACARSDAAESNHGPVDTRPLSQITPLDNPKEYRGPSTAALPRRTIKPVADSPAQSLPAKVTSFDHGGDKQVVVKDTSRALAIDRSGSLAATVWGLGFGDSLVGRDVSTTIPGTEELPVVTSGGHSINAESVLALKPTVVITDGSIGPRDVVEQLRDAGVTVVFVKNEPSYEGSESLARQIAAVYGAPAVGDKLAGHIKSQVDDAHRQISRWAPEGKDDKLSMIFLYLRGSSGVYYLFGRESGASDLIEGLGGVDVAAQMGWSGMKPMTDEAIIAADPDLILVMTDGLKSAGGIDRLLEDKPAISMTAAGKNRRFVDMADSVVLSFGPHSAGILTALARAVYAPEQ